MNDSNVMEEIENILNKPPDIRTDREINMILPIIADLEFFSEMTIKDDPTL